MKQLLALVLIWIYCIYEIYTEEPQQVELPEEIEKVLKLFDEEQRTMQHNDVWFRRSHVCYNDSFYSPVGDKNNKEVKEECDGTITWIMCNATVLGYERRRVHTCCAGFEDVKGDKCKEIGTDRDSSTQPDSSTAGGGDKDGGQGSTVANGSADGQQPSW